MKKKVNFREKKVEKLRKHGKVGIKREKKSDSGKEKREKKLIFTLCQRQSLERHYCKRNIKL